jgi:hypothetical protein
VRQIEVRVFEKVQKAVKNGVAAIGTPVHQPMHELPGLSRWGEKLPMDCRYGYVSATESREKRAVHRAPRSAIHARNFASPIGSLSHALQMQSDPKFHRQSPETPLLITIRC